MVKRFDVTLEGLRQLRDRLDKQQVETDDWPLLGALVTKQIERAERRQERMLAKLAAAAAQGEVGGQEALGSATAGESPGSASSCGTNATSSSAAKPPATGGSQADAQAAKKLKGHGRNGAGAYTKAKHFHHALEDGVLGTVCEDCGFAKSKMYRYREKVIIRIVGQPLFAAEVHHYEQARCRNCGRVLRANGPENVREGLGSNYIRYDWSAAAMLLVMHYSAGAPFKRLESLHQGWGVPMPDANQWQVVNAADDLLLPLYKALEQHAIAKATNFRTDDTGSMVIALKKEIDAEIAILEGLGESTKDVRTGINATGFYWETPDGPVVLYYTGRHHAGEMVDQLLRRRLLTSPKLVKVTDGASKNFDHEHHDKLVEATCNAHAFLKFRDIRDKYPAEYAEAGSVYKQIFDHDDQAKALELTPVDRMLYHQKHSWPLMKKLKAMCEDKVKSKLVEPSSPLWQPLTFIINQWDRLTRFCKVPGVPLDTNLIEQALIMPVRYLAGSFNYKTEDGATVGDHAMSLIATARAHEVEPVAWLTDCLRCHEDLATRPEHYLPWVYRKRLEEESSAPGSARSPPQPEPRSESHKQARGLRDLAPKLRERAGGRVATPDQDLQLTSKQL